MKALNLAIYTGSDDDHKVTMTATCESHEEAVRFHEGVARLCKETSLQKGGTQASWPKLLLPGR